MNDEKWGQSTFLLDADGRKIGLQGLLAEKCTLTPYPLALEQPGLITRDIENAYLAFDPSEEAPIQTFSASDQCPG